MVRRNPHRRFLVLTLCWAALLVAAATRACTAGSPQSSGTSSTASWRRCATCTSSTRSSGCRSVLGLAFVLDGSLAGERPTGEAAWHARTRSAVRSRTLTRPTAAIAAWRRSRVVGLPSRRFGPDLLRGRHQARARLLAATPPSGWQPTTEEDRAAASRLAGSPTTSGVPQDEPMQYLADSHVGGPQRDPAGTTRQHPDARRHREPARPGAGLAGSGRAPAPGRRAATSWCATTSPGGATSRTRSWSTRPSPSHRARARWPPSGPTSAERATSSSTMTGSSVNGGWQDVVPRHRGLRGAGTSAGAQQSPPTAGRGRRSGGPRGPRRPGRARRGARRVGGRRAEGLDERAVPMRAHRRAAGPGAVRSRAVHDGASAVLTPGDGPTVGQPDARLPDRRGRPVVDDRGPARSCRAVRQRLGLRRGEVGGSRSGESPYAAVDGTPRPNGSPGWPAVGRAWWSVTFDRNGVAHLSGPHRWTLRGRGPGGASPDGHRAAETVELGPGETRTVALDGVGDQDPARRGRRTRDRPAARPGRGASRESGCNGPGPARAAERLGSTGPDSAAIRRRCPHRVRGDRQRCPVRDPDGTEGRGARRTWTGRSLQQSDVYDTALTVRPQPGRYPGPSAPARPAARCHHVVDRGPGRACERAGRGRRSTRDDVAGRSRRRPPLAQSELAGRAGGVRV